MVKGVCGVHTRDIAATRSSRCCGGSEAGHPSNVSVNLLNNRSLIPTVVILPRKYKGVHMIAQELEVSFGTWPLLRLRQQRHEFITVEHLLLALLDNPSAAEVLRA